MFVYNFQHQWADLVAQGHKPHTIRGHRADGRVPAPGDHLRMYTDMRRRTCRKILEAVCTRVEEITIAPNGWVSFRPYGLWENAHPERARKIAKRDGFQSFDAFLDYFTGKNRDRVFTGHLIHFRPMRDDELAEISTIRKLKN